MGLFVRIKYLKQYPVHTVHQMSTVIITIKADSTRTKVLGVGKQ